MVFPSRWHCTEGKIIILMCSLHSCISTLYLSFKVFRFRVARPRWQPLFCTTHTARRSTIDKLFWRDSTNKILVWLKNGLKYCRIPPYVETANYRLSKWHFAWEWSMWSLVWHDFLTHKFSTCDPQDPFAAWFSEANALPRPVMALGSAIFTALLVL